MPFRVDVMEYERGWGSRLDEKVYFNDLAKAEEYVETFNSVNTEKTVPDWYMVAETPFFVPAIPVSDKARDD